MAKGGSKGAGRGSSPSSKANLKNAKKADVKKENTVDKMAMVDKMEDFHSTTQIKPNKISFQNPFDVLSKVDKELGGMRVQAKLQIENGEVKGLTIPDGGSAIFPASSFKRQLKKYGGNYEVLGAGRDVNNAKLKDAIENKKDFDGLVNVFFKDSDIVK